MLPAAKTLVIWTTWFFRLANGLLLTLYLWKPPASDHPLFGKGWCDLSKQTKPRRDTIGFELEKEDSYPH